MCVRLGQRVLLATLTILTVVSMLLTPAPASATTFTWKSTFGGNWADKDHWTCDTFSGPCRDGYPNAAGDVARFPVSAPAGVAIILDREIRVGTIVLEQFVGDQFMAQFGTGGKLIFDNGATEATIVRDTPTVPTNIAMSLQLPVVLQSSLRIATGNQLFLLNGVISGPGGLTIVTQSNVHMTAGPGNTYTGGTTVWNGTLNLGAVNGPIGVGVPGPLVVGDGVGTHDAQVFVRRFGQIPLGARVTVNGDGVLEFQADQRFGFLTINDNGLVTALTSTLEFDHLIINAGPGLAGTLEGKNGGAIVLHGHVTASGGFIRGNGAQGVPALVLDGTHRFTVLNGGTLFVQDLRLFTQDPSMLIKDGPGTLSVVNQVDTYAGTTQVLGGTLLMNGLQNTSAVDLQGGVLGGIGAIGALIAAGGSIAPGVGPGRLQTGQIALSPGVTFTVELNGTAAGTQYDQLDVRGGVSLGSAALAVSLSFRPPKDSQFVIIANDNVDPVTSTFNGLPEGATLTVNNGQFRISYRGGDGNDVVLTAIEPPPPVPITYYLSEGATGFFDEDILIANPTDQEAPVTITFSKENGEQVQATRTLAPQSHRTVPVAAIPGLENSAASAQVTSTNGVPLVVERSMFWDKSHYGGHTGSSVDKPAQDWFFAEGSQGYFETFVLVINPNDSPTDVTFTFLREGAAPVVKTYTVGKTTRLTLHAGDLPELVNSSFGIAVHATRPIMAERAMYFGAPAHSLSGGTESAGVTAPSTHWFLAEGATGSFFNTFVLLSNPNNGPAHVTLQYLLDSGEPIFAPKTIPANARLTVNIGAEDDARLQNITAVSTVVTSDVPIIAERSMYWAGQPWREGHNSFGVVDAALRWGLAEGRSGGPFNYHTFILLANPQSTDAQVKVTYLRDSGAPVVKTYTVPATSRFNVDVGAVTELQDQSFGSVIEVTNSVPIIVERSLYWDANGVVFSGGTSATGIRLP